MFSKSVRDCTRRLKWIHWSVRAPLFMTTQNFRHLLSLSKSGGFEKIDKIEFHAVIKHFWMAENAMAILGFPRCDPHRLSAAGVDDHGVILQRFIDPV